MRKLLLKKKPFYCNVFGDKVTPSPHPSKPGLFIGDIRSDSHELVPQSFRGFANKHVAFMAFRKDEMQPVFELPSYTPRTPYVFADHTFRSYKYVREIKQNLHEYACINIDYPDTIAVASSGELRGISSGYRVYRIPFSIIATILSRPLIGGHAVLWRDDWTPFLHKRDMCVYNREFYSIENMCYMRTRLRIRDGIYYPVPSKFPVAAGTGVHLSTLDDKLLAYYPTKAHILSDKPQRIKPGRYIKKYFPHMSDDEIRQLSAHIGGFELVFYSKGEDMIDAYMELSNSGIVSSCMSKRNWYPHPLMVYDNSDVELAVLRVNGEPVARALYNKHTREYPMVYGQWERMRVALDKAGFKHGVLDGAHINVIKVGRAYRMPYIDGHRKLDRSANNSTRVSPDNKCGTWVIDADGIFPANSHDLASTGRDYKFDNSVPNHDVAHDCKCCGEIVYESEGVYIEYDEVYIHESCDEGYRVYTRHGLISCLSPHNFVEIDGAYFEDSDVAEEHDYRYSGWHSQWIRLDDAVWVDDANDWLHVDDDGVVFTYVQGYNDPVLIENLELSELFVVKNNDGTAELLSFNGDGNQSVTDYYAAGGNCPLYVAIKTWRHVEDQISSLHASAAA